MSQFNELTLSRSQIKKCRIQSHHCVSDSTVYSNSIKAFEDTSVKTDHKLKSREVTLTFW